MHSWGCGDLLLTHCGEAMLLQIRAEVVDGHVWPAISRAGIRDTPTNESLTFEIALFALRVRFPAPVAMPLC
jgi:hypothetical protein